MGEPPHARRVAAPTRTVMTLRHRPDMLDLNLIEELGIAVGRS